MKFPWFTSDKSSKENMEPIEDNQNKKLNKTYNLSSLPENLQKIVILIKKNDEEIKYLKKKLDVSLNVKKILEDDLSRKLQSINE